MKRTDLRTLLSAATANGTLLGIAVSDAPDAPLFDGPLLPPVCGECGEHVTLDGDTAASEPAPVEHVILPEEL